MTTEARNPIGNQLSATGTIKATSKRFLGTPPGHIAMGGSAVGEATLEDGSKVTITWGRNIDREEQEWYLKHTGFQPIHIGSDYGHAELILPPDVATEILKTLNRH